MTSAIITDANGIRTLNPPPSGVGGELLLLNDSDLSTFVTALQTQITTNDAEILALDGAVAANDAEILSLQNAATAVSVTNYSTIAAAQVAATLAGGWLLFPPGTYLIESDLTFTVPVVFAGGVIRQAVGVTITFEQPYMNPSMQQCFDEQGRTPNQVGGVKVAVASPQTTVRPEDWGAVCDGTTDGQEVPIQQAIDAVTYPNVTNKVGRVLFSSGIYLCADAIFVGFDWITYAADWVARSYVCRRGNALSAASRKTQVVLEGVGAVYLKYTGLEALTSYLLYYSGVNTTQNPIACIKNMGVDCQYNCRGVYFSYQTYGKTIDGLYLYRTTNVGLDYIDCIVGRLLNVFSSRCRGISVRTRQANSCYVESILVSKCRGQLDSHFPSPDEEVVQMGTGDWVQTKVWERGALDFSGDTTEYHNTLIEEFVGGSATLVQVSADRKTCYGLDHGLEAGDPIWWHENSVQTTVASVTDDDHFVMADEWAGAGAATSKLIYRRCSAIDQLANPGVFTCQNHGMAEGQWVKIMAPSGMVELNDVWYRVKLNGVDDANEFSLWTTWEEGGVGFGGALDISLFAPADGSEYIVTSVAGVVFNSKYSRLINTRFEGNSLLRSKILSIQPESSVVDGVSMIIEGGRGYCDYAVEWRGRVFKSSILNLYGLGIEKYVVWQHNPFTGFRYASSNTINGTNVRLEASTRLMGGIFGTDETAEQYNNIEGAVSPGTPVSDGLGGIPHITTPLVYNSLHSAPPGNRDYIVYGAVLYVAVGHDKDTGGAGVGAITNFLGGVNGQLLRVHFLGALSRVNNNATIVTITGANVDPAAHDELTFRNIGGVWHQV